MSHSNPLLPPGSSLEDRKQRKTKILVTVFGIVALHVVPISGLLLMQGCKPEFDPVETAMETANPDDFVPPANDEVPSLNTNEFYRDFPSQDPTLSVPVNMETPPARSQNESISPTIATEVYLDEPGENEVDPHPYDNPTGTESVTQDSLTETPSGASPSYSPSVERAAAPMTATAHNSTTGRSETATERTPAGNSNVDYRIQAGDRLYSLAKQYGTKVSAIMEANPGLDPRKLRIGQAIRIPRAEVSTSVRSATPASSQVAGGRTYKVVRGDNLTKIARRHGISLGALRKANNLRSDRILVGQKLTIPVAEVASVKN